MNIEQRKFIDKWLLILLATNDFKPIRGRVRLVKEFFLIWQNHFKDLGNIAEFYPYHFGPYSTLLAVRVNQLHRNNIIRFSESGQDILYGLTNKGKEKAYKFLLKVDEVIINTIKEDKIRFAELSTGKLLGEIYRKFPNFAVKSLISEESDIKGKFLMNLLNYEKVDDGPGFVKSTSISEDFHVSEKYKKEFLEKIMN